MAAREAGPVARLVVAILAIQLLASSVLVSAEVAAQASPTGAPSATAETAVPANRPRIHLDTGGHTDIIRALAVGEDGRHLYSGSDDGSVRRLDLESGRSQRIVQNEGACCGRSGIVSLAVSEQAGWLAAASRWRPEIIALYEPQSGRKLGELATSGFVRMISASARGDRLLSGGLDGWATLWDMPQRTALARLGPHPSPITALALSPDGNRAATVAWDHVVRLWDPREATPLAQLQGHSAEVRAMAFSGATGQLASGGRDKIVRIWDARTGAAIRQCANLEIEVYTLSYSPDGRHLLMCGAAPNRRCAVCDAASGAPVHRYEGHDDDAVAGIMAPTGGLAVTAGGGRREVHLWRPSTDKPKPLAIYSGAGAMVRAVGFSSDGTEMMWGRKLQVRSVNNRGPLQWSLALPVHGRRLGEPHRRHPGLLARWLGSGEHRAREQIGTLSLDLQRGGAFNRKAVLEIKRSGQVVGRIQREEESGHVHRSYSLVAGADVVVSGGMAGTLAAYALDGSKLGDFVGHDGDVVALAVSPDGQLMVSGATDQTVRLWNVRTRKLLLTVFSGADGVWSAWTPSGYFIASEKGKGLLAPMGTLPPGDAGAASAVEQFRARYGSHEQVEHVLREGIAASTAAPGGTRAEGSR